MDPREFLEVASELVAVDIAGRIRTAINRAYYAAHNVGVEVLTEMGCKIEKGPGGHADVWMRLNNSGDIEVQKVGSKLGDLQSKRIKADYRLDNTDVEDQKTATADIEVARGIIQVLDACCSGQKRDKIIAEIRNWERKTGKI
jgi:hypothetical protein